MRKKQKANNDKPHQRPFLNFYGPTFILYELSSPFLNFHWFLDKLQLTGSRAQWYNGILLLASFFCCRLLWGTYQSLRVYQDCWAALHLSSSKPTGIPAMLEESVPAKGEIMRFHPSPEDIPTWLAVTYLGSNILLNTLNFYWFGKMIETVKSRFEPQDQGKEKKEEKKRKVDAVVEGVELDDRVDEEVKSVGEGSGFEKADGEVKMR